MRVTDEQASRIMSATASEDRGALRQLHDCAADLLDARRERDEALQRVAELESGGTGPATPPPPDEAHRLLAMGDKFDRRLEAEDMAIHVSADGRGRWRYVMADGSVLVRQRRQGKPDEWSVEPRP